MQVIAKSIKIELPVRASVELIKAIRGLTGWGLKEAKDFMDQNLGRYVSLPVHVIDGSFGSRGETGTALQVFDFYLRALQSTGVRVVAQSNSCGPALKELITAAVANDEFALVSDLCALYVKHYGR